MITPDTYFHFEEIICLRENIFKYLCKNKLKLMIKIFGSRVVIQSLYFVSFFGNLKHLNIIPNAFTAVR